jgi:hypothetical protein
MKRYSCSSLKKLLSFHSLSLLSTPFLSLLFFFLLSCSPSGDPIHLNRFEQLLFDTPSGELRNVLIRDSALYNTPLLNCQPDDPEYMAYLRAFVSDPDIRYIYHKTDSLYHDLSWLESDLGTAMKKARELCPDIIYDRYYTLITADFESYDTRVFCYNRDLAISIDRYALPEMEERNFFLMPAYLVNLSTRDHILADCMSAVATDHITLPVGNLTLLDHAIFSGKILYFLDQTLPDVPDHIKLRYTPEQFDWMKENVENVWGAFIQKQLLFSTDKYELRNLIGDGPKTNAFGDGSAPRTCDYIGWQIVKHYMDNSGVSLADLFADTDSRKILNKSQWRPGK